MDAGHDNAVMAILGLQSPPIDFPLRTRRSTTPLGAKWKWSTRPWTSTLWERCPPYNQLLAGKLAVYAGASQEVREAYQQRYSEAVTEIEDRVLPAHLVLLTTTSAFGRSSLYNRIRYRGRDGRPAAG